MDIATRNAGSHVKPTYTSADVVSVNAGLLEPSLAIPIDQFGPSQRSLSETCRDLVYRDALSRHVSDMEARATEAMHAKKLWKEKIMTDQLRYEIDSNRIRNKSRENAKYLLRQMQLNEQKRKSDKMKQIADASCHDFPGIGDHTPCDRVAAVRARKELDLQLLIERRLRTSLRTRDLELARKFQDQNRIELARLHSERTAKKLQNKYVLNEAWNRDLRIKNCWKAIESFDCDNMHESISFLRPHSSR